MSKKHKKSKQTKNGVVTMHNPNARAESKDIVGNRIFYWAYGSNLCIEQMKRRCPRATKWGRMDVNNSALVFRSVADVTVREGAVTPGGLWLITPECERSLDQYEGIAAKVYMKRYFEIKLDDGSVHTCLFYQMRANRGILPPTRTYLGTIAQGYEDFKLPKDILDQYVSEAWGTKEMADHIADRIERAGGQLDLAKDVADARKPAKVRLPAPMWGEEWRS